MHIKATIRPERLTVYVGKEQPGQRFLGPEMHLSLGHVVVPLTEMAQEGVRSVGIHDDMLRNPHITFALDGWVDEVVFSEGAQTREYPTAPPPSNWHVMLDMFAHSFLLGQAGPLRPFSSHLPSAWLLAGHMKARTSQQQQHRFVGLLADYGWSNLFLLPPHEVALKLTLWALDAAEIPVPPPSGVQ
jgi:hypothetical protein